MKRRSLFAGMFAGILAAALALPSCKPKVDQKAPIKVAAASDLSKAFEEVGAAYEKETGKKVAFSFGSTGLLSKQIIEGAPFDVFAAANVSFVDEVVTAGKCDKSTQALYARGRIVVWTKKGAAHTPKTLSDLKDPAYAKIAIANPEHAPYGRAAKEALQGDKVWEDVEKRMVFGENVSQTLQYADTGNADVAIVALSLAIGSGGEYFTIDESLHKPLEQALVVCAGSERAAGAKEFATFVNSEKGRDIMKKWGFLLPGETVTAR